MKTGILLVAVGMLSCTPRPQPQSCNKSYIALKKDIPTKALNQIAGGGLPDSNLAASFLASGILKMKSITRDASGGYFNCAAIVSFEKKSGVYELEIITSKHCTSGVDPSGHSISISGLDGYRQLSFESAEISRMGTFRDLVASRGLKYRAETSGLLHRPFENYDYRNKIGNTELNSIVQQELATYGGYLCGRGTVGPISINAQKACFMFSDMVAFKAKTLPGSDDIILSIQKGKNISTNFLASAHPEWMSLVRSRGSVSSNYEIGRVLHTIKECFGNADAQATCNDTDRQNAMGLMADLQSRKLLDGTIFSSFGSLSYADRTQLVQKSIDDLLNHYSRQIKIWQFLRADLSKRTLTLGASLSGKKGLKFSLVNFKDFQGSVPFIWRPYGVVAYVDLSLANLQPGVSGSFVFLDNTPVLSLSRVNEENTSGGVAIPRPEGASDEEIKLPSAEILNAAQWKEKERSSGIVDNGGNVDDHKGGNVDDHKGGNEDDQITYGRTEGC